MNFNDNIKSDRGVYNNYHRKENLIHKAKILNIKRSIFKTNQVNYIENNILKTKIHGAQELNMNNLEIPLNSNLLKYNENYQKGNKSSRNENINSLRNINNELNINNKNDNSLVKSIHSNRLKNDLVTSMTPYQKNMFLNDLQRKRLKIKLDTINNKNQSINQLINQNDNNMNLMNNWNENLIDEQLQNSDRKKQIPIEENSSIIDQLYIRKPTILINSNRKKTVLQNLKFNLLPFHNNPHQLSELKREETSLNISKINKMDIANKSSDFLVKTDVKSSVVSSILNTKSNRILSNINDLSHSNIYIYTSSLNNPLITIGDKKKQNRENLMNYNKDYSSNDRLSLPLISHNYQNEVQHKSILKNNSNMNINSNHNEYKSRPKLGFTNKKIKKLTEILLN